MTDDRPLRERVAEAIEELICGGVELGDHAALHHRREHALRVADAAIAVAAPGWRLIDEQTPRGEGEWIWGCRAGSKIPAVMGWDEDTGWFSFNGALRPTWKPTHWMPIIPPPEDVP